MPDRSCYYCEYCRTDGKTEHNYCGNAGSWARGTLVHGYFTCEKWQDKKDTKN